MADAISVFGFFAFNPNAASPLRKQGIHPPAVKKADPFKLQQFNRIQKSGDRMTKLIPQETIASKILFLRGEKVLLDRDLAKLYGVETRVLNQAVSRNIRRFPRDFMFTLTREEIMRISQIVTSSEIKYSKRVHAFTEQGVAMLSADQHS